jgi:ferritin
MPGTAIKPAVLTELQRQFNFELAAGHSYHAMALWCEEQNFKGFARFFHDQAGEEQTHSRKIIDHLLNRGALPELAGIPAPKGKFKSLMEVAKHAQALEYANTMGVNQAYEAALKEKDFAAQVLLHWFINEQVEEEDWADEIVDRVEKAGCAGGLMDLDRHIARYLTDGVVEEDKKGA